MLLGTKIGRQLKLNPEEDLVMLREFWSMGAHVNRSGETRKN